MTRDDIIRMAKQAGVPVQRYDSLMAAERFAELVAAAEREAAEARMDDLFAKLADPPPAAIIAAIRDLGHPRKSNQPGGAG